MNRTNKHLHKHIHGFPNKLTPKMAKNHEMSVYLLTNAILALCHAPASLRNSKRAGFQTKVVIFSFKVANRYKFSTSYIWFFRISPFAWPGDLRSRARIATPIKIRLVPAMLIWKLARKSAIMHGILGSTWPKMALASYLKIKEETLLVYCLYFVGFLVRSPGGFDCEYLPIFSIANLVIMCFK